MALRDEIRTWVLIQGKSQRSAAQHFGISRHTVTKLLEEEPGPMQRRYQREAKQETPVRDVAIPHIEKWLKEADKSLPQTSRGVMTLISPNNFYLLFKTGEENGHEPSKQE